MAVTYLGAVLLAVVVMRLGSPLRLDGPDPDHISTSYVERHRTGGLGGPPVACLRRRYALLL